MTWVGPLVHGCAALLGTALVFAAARYRFRSEEESDGPGDLGLD